VHLPHFDHASAQEILAWGFETFGERIALSTAFGPSGVVLMHLASQIRPGVRVFFIDTGFHFTETMEMIHRIDERLNVQIQVIQPQLDIQEQAAIHGDELYVINPDKCCNLRKVEPNLRMLRELDGWVTALRRDQGPTRANLAPTESKSIEGRRLIKVNPMVRWTRAEVWRHIFEHDLPYNPLHDRGFTSVGCAPCSMPATNPSDERSGRWSGSQKTECGLHTQL
jgi:phosphoadenosine phosphosulfate reductase